MDKRYPMLTPVAGPTLMLGIAERAFLNPGTVVVDVRGAHPTWLPPVAETVYLDPETSGLYTVTSPPGVPVEINKEGPLGLYVLGPHAYKALRRKATVDLVFANSAITVLSQCLEDDAQLDLPASKARRALERVRPITVTYAIMMYALSRAVSAVGRSNARFIDPAPQDAPPPHHVPLTVPPNEAWTLRRVFGSVHLA